MGRLVSLILTQRMKEFDQIGQFLPAQLPVHSLGHDRDVALRDRTNQSVMTRPVEHEDPPAVLKELRYHPTVADGHGTLELIDHRRVPFQPQCVIDRGHDVRRTDRQLGWERADAI